MWGKTTFNQQYSWCTIIQNTIAGLIWIVDLVNHYVIIFRVFIYFVQCLQALRRDTKMLDESKKPLNAMTVFSECIKYLKNEIHKHINKQLSGVKTTDIRYVLTVPAIWDEDSKQFMEEAAEQVMMQSKAYISLNI